MRIKFSCTRYFLAFVLLLIPLVATSHSGATGVVKERMDSMKKFKKDMKVLRKMIKGRIPLQTKKFVETGQKIVVDSQKLPALFPPQSNPHPSEADDLIWQEWDQFVESFQHMAQQAEILEKVARSGQSDALSASFKKLNNSCKQCHELYRQ